MLSARVADDGQQCLRDNGVVDGVGLVIERVSPLGGGGIMVG